MPLHAVRNCVLLGFALAVSAFGHEFSAPGWALSVDFPAAPQVDDQRLPTDRGDELAERRHVEVGAERYMLTRISYPVAPLATERRALFAHAIQSFMSSRAGEIREDEQLLLGEYPCHRLLIEHRREKTHREVRLILAGGALYFISAEWPGGRTPSAAAVQFLRSLAITPEYADARLADERSRWREVAEGSFRLRFDASRWFRDPAHPAGSGSVVLMRVDELAEAEFVVGPRSPHATMEEVVLANARENADRVALRKRGRKLQGSATVEELRFSVRADGVTYENHGYFYNGPEGSVQVRAWSPEKTFAQVAGDISELLDGLTIQPARTDLVGR